MCHLSVFLFGAPRIECGGRSIEIGLRKATALFSYLAITKQPYSRDALATLFWPQAGQGTALGSLRRTLHRLNSALEGEVLLSTRKTVELNPQVELWLDVELFQQQVTACLDISNAAGTDTARPPLSGGLPNPLSCLSRLEEAAGLYTNDFLAGFSLPDSPGFDEWQFFQAEGLRRSFGNVLARLAQVYRDGAMWEKAIGAARRWVALDPLDDFAQRSLIKLYARTGQQAAALHQYQELQRLLSEELGAEPEAETTALYHAIKSRQLLAPEAVEPGLAELPWSTRPALPAGPAPSREVFSPGPPQNLPAQPYPFVGRKIELAEVRRLLVENGSCRLLTVVGPGGIGKTRLALEAAHNALRAFPDGVYFIPLASLPAADHVVPVIAEHLGLRSHDGSLQAHLLSYLSKKRLLLVLDNFEHLLPGAGVIAEILQRAPMVKVLVTSRERLGISSEQVYVLSSMAYPEGDSASDILEFGAIQLFVQCARLARPQIEILPQDFPHLIRICRLVQGMPLAIVLAAGWLEALSIREVAEEIEGGLDFLESRMGDVSERHCSMRAAFDGSWKRLSPQDQQVYMRLSVFRGGFTRQAAQCVAGAGLQSIRTLIQKSLVSVRRDGRYEIHDLLRQYAAEQLEISGAGEALRYDHSRYYLDLLTQHEADLKGARQFDVLEAIDADFENIWAGWSWAVGQQVRAGLDRQQQHRLAAALGQASEALYLFFAFRSRYPDGAEMFSLAREALQPCPHPESRAACAQVIARSAWLQTVSSAQDERIEADIRACLDLAQRRQDRAEEAFCWLVLGMHTYLARQDPAAALSYYQRGLAISEAIEDDFYIACGLYYIGECHGQVTGLETMVAFTRQSLELCRRTGNKAVMAFDLHNLARAAFYAGDDHACEDYCREALLLDDQMGLNMGIADSKTLLSILHFLRGDLEQAAALAGECLEIGREIGFTLAESEALAVLSLLSAIREQAAAGKQLGEDSLGMLSSSLGKILAHWGVSAACCELGEDGLARSHVQRALGEARRLSLPGLLYLPVPVAALLESRQGRAEAAAELLSLASRGGGRSLTGWWNRWPLLAELGPQLQASLGEQGFHLAWERGRVEDPSSRMAELLPELALPAVQTSRADS